MRALLAFFYKISKGDGYDDRKDVEPVDVGREPRQEGERVALRRGHRGRAERRGDPT